MLKDAAHESQGHFMTIANIKEKAKMSTQDSVRHD